MGITLEEIEVNASLPINPTIIRIMRVLRIARGRFNTWTRLPQREMERVGYSDGSGFPGAFSQPLYKRLVQHEWAEVWVDHPTSSNPAWFSQLCDGGPGGASS